MDEQAREYGEEDDNMSSQFADTWLPRIAASIQRGNALALAITRAPQQERYRVAVGCSTGGRRPFYQDDSY